MAAASLFALTMPPRLCRMRSVENCASQASPVALDPEQCVRERLGEWIERGVIEPEE